MSTTVVYTTSWEQGDTWRTLLWRPQDCPRPGGSCPSATFTFSSPAAARTGNFGVAINIIVKSTDAWHVQLSSPAFKLSSAQVYKACFWLRTTIGGGAFVQMNLNAQAADGSYSWITGTSTKVTSDWRQACTPDFTPPPAAASVINYVYVLDLGLLTGTVFVDDFTLTSRPDTTAADAAYCNATNVAARINTHRKGNFSLMFVNKTTNKLLGNASLVSLKLRLATHDFPFGSAMEWDSVPADKLKWYLATARKHFNALVPEWRFKWPEYEPTKGQFQASQASLMINHISFAAANEFVLARGHTLEWLTNYTLKHWSRKDGCDAYQSYLYTRITREVTAFKGKFQQYDVFNEILHHLEFVKGCPGMWPRILYDGFRWAAAADPTAQLCLNDYNLITGDRWRDMVTLVRDMKAEGVPIHCIGVQAYIPTENRPKPVYMKPRLEAMAALNVSIMISEFNFMSYWDRDVPVWAGTDAEHAALYNEYVRFWFSLPYVRGMLMWGFWDSMNWIRNGGVYSANGTPKASATTLLSLWGSVWNTTVSATNVKLPSTALYGPYNGFYGKYGYEVTIGATNYTGFVHFPAQGGTQQTAKVFI